MTRLRDVPGVLTAEQLAATGAYISSQQSPDGAIPWHRGGKFDLWDHVESAMGLLVVGRVHEAEAALRWCARTQRADGSWPADGGVLPHIDVNQCAYVAVGLWHHHLVTERIDLLVELWPMLERATEFVISTQLSSGALAWAVDAGGSAVDEALVTGSASCLQSIECALLIADRLGHQRPHWTAAGRRLADALRRGDCFVDKSRFAMDWYYPVLAGAVRGGAAIERFDASWEHFVWADHGCRCVSDQPWVTAAESAELVAALHSVGENNRASRVFADLQTLRDAESGAYWTGRNIPNDAIWPVELATWTSAAVLLAADALTGMTGGATIFRDAGRLWSVSDPLFQPGFRLKENP